MTTGQRVTERHRRWVLSLLRETRRPGSSMKWSQIPEITGLHRQTVADIRDEAAVAYLDWLEEHERARD